MIAAWTSAAAASISRFSTNWIAIEVEPCAFVVEIVSMPAMVPNCLTKGVAIDVAMVSGEAPGSCAETLMTGNSARGRAATGRKRQANSPASTSETDIRMVATGCLMQKDEMFMSAPLLRPECSAAASRPWRRARVPACPASGASGRR